MVCLRAKRSTCERACGLVDERRRWMARPRREIDQTNVKYAAGRGGAEREGSIQGPEKVMPRRCFMHVIVILPALLSPLLWTLAIHRTDIASWQPKTPLKMAPEAAHKAIPSCPSRRSQSRISCIARTIIGTRCTFVYILLRFGRKSTRETHTSQVPQGHAQGSPDTSFTTLSRLSPRRRHHPSSRE